MTSQFKKFAWRLNPFSAGRSWGLFLLLVALAFLPINTTVSALDKEASFALSHYIMAVMYDDLGEIDKAIQEYKKALTVDNDSSVIHLNLAESLIKKNNIPQAIQELNLVARLSPEAIEPHAILAILYSSENKLDLARAEYEIALKGASKLNPKNIDIYKSLGLIYLQEKRFKEAIETYQLISDLSPLDAQAHFYLGSIYNELRNNALAEKELKRAMDLKPDYHEALNFLGYLYVDENRNLPQAEAMIRKALELEPDNGAYIDSLGWLYFRQGNFKKALEELKKASVLLEDPVIYDHLADAYFKINDNANARLNWEKSLKLDPNQEAVRKKMERLKSLNEKKAEANKP